MPKDPALEARREEYLRQAQRDRIIGIPEMCELANTSRWTIRRAGQRGELRLIKLTSKNVGARASEFWRWIDSKAIPTNDAGGAS